MADGVLCFRRDTRIRGHEDTRTRERAQGREDMRTRGHEKGHEEDRARGPPSGVHAVLAVEPQVVDQTAHTCRRKQNKRGVSGYWRRRRCAAPGGATRAEVG